MRVYTLITCVCVCVCVCVYYRSIVVNLLYTIAECSKQRSRVRWWWWRRRRRFTRAPLVCRVSCWIQIWLVFGSTDARKTLVKIILGTLCHSATPTLSTGTHTRSPLLNERKTETHKIQRVIDLSYTHAQRVGRRLVRYPLSRSPPCQGTKTLI